jgi:hypothetical protein
MGRIQGGRAREVSFLQIYSIIFQHINNLICFSLNMGWKNYPLWLENGFDYENPIHKSLAGKDFIWVYTIEEMREEINENL